MARAARQPEQKSPPLLGTLQNSGDVRISCVISKDLHGDLSIFLQERGLSLTDFVRMAFRQSMRGYRIYGPNDILRFGKYSGEKLEYVIRMAPDYIAWAKANMANFRITDEAWDLFIELTDPGSRGDPQTGEHNIE